MNIHPIVVHFPVALLTIYALMEFVWSRRLKNNISWFYVKAAFLILGLLGGYAGLSSGDVAADSYNGDGARSLIHMHESWANLTTGTFLILAMVYILTYISHTYPKLFHEYSLEKFWLLLLEVKNIILNTPVKYVIVLFGLVAVTITGALGGALVYGPNVDPIVSFIYNLLLPFM